MLFEKNAKFIKIEKTIKITLIKHKNQIEDNNGNDIIRTIRSKKRIFMKKSFIWLTIISSSISFSANNYIAFIKKTDSSSPYNIGSLTEESENIVENGFKELKCIWANCIGLKESNEVVQLKYSNNTVTTTTLEQIENLNTMFKTEDGVYIKDNNKIYGLGRNLNGSLGVNSTESRIYDPVETFGLPFDVKKILMGNDRRTRIALTNNGLYYSGNNSIDGYLALDENESVDYESSEFVNFLTDSNIVDFAFSDDALAYVKNGKLYVKGYNVQGSFGTGDEDVNYGGDSEYFGYYESFVEVPNLSGVSSVSFISHNSDVSMLIIKDGTIWTAGSLGHVLGVENTDYRKDVFFDTGFHANKLQIDTRDGQTTILIKDKKAYYSGMIMTSNPPYYEESKAFKLIDDLKDYNIKYVIEKESIIHFLTTDGRILKESATFNPDYSFKSFTWEEVEYPEYYD